MRAEKDFDFVLEIVTMWQVKFYRKKKNLSVLMSLGLWPLPTPEESGS